MLNPPAVGKELKFFQYVDGNNFVFWTCLLHWFLAALDNHLPAEPTSYKMAS